MRKILIFLFVILVLNSIHGQSAAKMNGFYLPKIGGVELSYYNDSSKTMKISRDVSLPISEIKEIQIIKDGKNSSINIHFTPKGLELMNKISTDNIGRELIFVVNDKIIVSPTFFIIIKENPISIKFSHEEEKVFEIIEKAFPDITKTYD